VSDVRALRVSTHGNTAAAYNKLENWREALKACDKVLTIEADNTKAFFRRGIAQAGLGLLEEAKDDFTKVAKAEPKNRAAREELAKVKEGLKVKKEEEKARMKGLFSGKSMYDDKEKEKKAKAKAEAEKKAREATAKKEAEAKLKVEWEAEEERRKEAGEESISWEDFEKAAKKKKEEEEKEAEKAAEAAKEAEKEAKRQAREAARAEAGHTAQLEVDSDDEALLADIKKGGYGYFGNTGSGSCGSKEHSGVRIDPTVSFPVLPMTFQDYHDPDPKLDFVCRWRLPLVRKAACLHGMLLGPL